MPWRIPPPEVQARVASIVGDKFWPDFHASVQRLRLQEPRLEFTSWYRDPSSNRAAGGATFSQHQAGTAFDVVPPAGQWDRIAAAIRAQGFAVRDERNVPGVRPHLHVAAFTDEAWARGRARMAAQLRPLFVSER